MAKELRSQGYAMGAKELESSDSDTRDDEILKAVALRGGAAKAELAELYEKYRRPLLRFFVTRGASADDASDLLQETIIKVLKGAKSYQGQGTARAWIWQVARNCLLDYLRKAKRLPEISEHDLQTESTPAFAPSNICLESALSEASADAEANALNESLDSCVQAVLKEFAASHPARHQALWLAALGNTVQEIAETIGRTVGATKVYLFECRKKLAPMILHCKELLNA